MCNIIGLLKYGKAKFIIPSSKKSPAPNLPLEQEKKPIRKIKTSIINIVIIKYKGKFAELIKNKIKEITKEI